MAAHHENVKRKKGNHFHLSSNQSDAGKKQITIEIPCGGQVIRYFDLTPKLPIAGQQSKWLFTEAGDNEQIGNIHVGFCENQSHLERHLERAILIVRIKNDHPEQGLWRFAMGGVATFAADTNPHNDLDAEMVDNGFTLMFRVDAPEDCDKFVNFQFVASYTETATGIVTVYQSDDPGIGSKRPA